ncbi:hypothetical protein M514_06394 [Trichuris suis]|uniref:Uncharacterized protein n=1 Tax=Trichuris suis TaxID=68888 RepID=A0A085NPX7_9BILA|nr:hypothetical protein M514_06394 [Trichuris suis]
MYGNAVCYFHETTGFRNPPALFYSIIHSTLTMGLRGLQNLRQMIQAKINHANERPSDKP